LALTNKSLRELTYRYIKKFKIPCDELGLALKKQDRSTSKPISKAEEITITGLSPTNQELADITELTSLKRLNLTKCNNRDIEQLANLFKNKIPNLEALYLNECYEMTDQGLRTILEKYPNLKIINFKTCNITNDGLSKVADFEGLEDLTLANCLEISQGLFNIVAQCQNLKNLNVSLSEKLTFRRI
jgi:hypothetical protein